MSTRDLIIRAFLTVSNTWQACSVSKPAWKGCWCWRLHLLLICSTYFQNSGNATLPPFHTLSLLCIGKISDEHVSLSPESNMTTHLSCFLPASMPSLQTENWAAAVLLSGKTKSHGIIFPIVFRDKCVFSLVLLHQYLSPMPLTNVVPWLSWPCYNLSFLSLLALCHLHLSLLHLDMILSSRTREAPSTISCKDGSGSREGRP